jgi:hypothetical protein
MVPVMCTCIGGLRQLRVQKGGLLGDPRKA